jgi:hypothetical protein
MVVVLVFLKIEAVPARLALRPCGSMRGFCGGKMV